MLSQTRHSTSRQSFFPGRHGMLRRYRTIPAAPKLGRTARSGFTLVEVLLVVAIVGVLGGVVVTVYGDASSDAKDAALMQNLQSIRVAVERFKVDHNGQLPGFTQLDDIGDHLTKYTNAAGAVSTTPSPSYPYGPYLPGSAIVNPVNQGYAVALSSDPTGETPDNEMVNGDGERVGWFLDASQGRIAANAEGQTAAGTPRISL